MALVFIWMILLGEKVKLLLYLLKICLLIYSQYFIVVFLKVDKVLVGTIRKIVLVKKQKPLLVSRAPQIDT
jgi:hypothetical protein